MPLNGAQNFTLVPQSLTRLMGKISRKLFTGMLGMDLPATSLHHGHHCFLRGFNMLIQSLLKIRGVAARALHLSRGVEKPSGRVTYIVVLEGLCRFSVQDLSTRGTYYTARITPLEMTKAGDLLIHTFYSPNIYAVQQL